MDSGMDRDIIEILVSLAVLLPLGCTVVLMAFGKRIG